MAGSGLRQCRNIKFSHHLNSSIPSADDNSAFCVTGKQAEGGYTWKKNSRRNGSHQAEYSNNQHA
jgi:hypothetical protein